MQWSNVEPILRGTYALMADAGRTTASAVIDCLGLDPDAARSALGALHRGGYIGVEQFNSNGLPFFILPTEKGLQLGAGWPARESSSTFIAEFLGAIEARAGDPGPPTCEHGEWRFAGADYRRQATKWRCPTGECQPASRWIKADRLHPLIPRETLRWRGLYKRRGAVEREFGRLKNEWGLAPLRVRRIERVRLHADLTILAKLSCALARARTIPLAA